MSNKKESKMSFLYPKEAPQPKTLDLNVYQTQRVAIQYDIMPYLTMIVHESLGRALIVSLD